jgi:hypothetical protein
VALALAAAAPCAAEPPYLVPAGEAVGGMSQADWSREWWLWAASFDARESPVADRTGARCASRQRGEVWFLAGTYGTTRTVRTCTVPRGAYLFFPLINFVVYPREGDADCASFVQQAARITDGATYLIVDLDGQRVERPESHRQATQCFDMGERASPPQRVYPAAANGYYVMIKPLPIGLHELNFGGKLPSMSQAVTYTIVVE